MAAVIIPSPPTCTRTTRIVWPEIVSVDGMVTGESPVTHTALTDKKNASSHDSPVLANGSFKRSIPIVTTPAKARTIS